MKHAAFILAVAAFLPLTGCASEVRSVSPTGLCYVVYRYSDADPKLVTDITFTDASGRALFIDDYSDRDYRPEVGHWTTSGRFFVYSLTSRGGHSPWHRPFVVADIVTRKCTSESDLGMGDCISEFRLSAPDTISYQVLDRSKENWDAGVPGISVRLPLAQKLKK